MLESQPDKWIAGFIDLDNKHAKDRENWGRQAPIFANVQ
jgi:hypothetical protein